MKKILLLFVVLLISRETQAQVDVSLWSVRVTDTKVRLVPWVIYTHSNGVMIDARYNYDWPEGANVYIGKVFTVAEGHSVAPMVGGLVAKDYTAFSPELYWFGSVGWATFTAQFLGAFSLSGDVEDWYYHWLDFQVPVTDWLSVGFDEQVLASVGADPVIDFGPAMKVKIIPLYLYAWPAFNVSGGDGTTLFVALGVSL